MKILSKSSLKNIFNALLVIGGTFIMGFAFNVFLNNYKISPSGFSGLCAIFSNILKQNLNVNIPASIMYLTINAILFIFAYKAMGIKYAIYSILGIVSYSVFMQVCNFNIGLNGQDLLLYSVYGGVLMGLGLGLIFRGGGSTGGSEMLAGLLNKKFRAITVGNFIFIINIFVVALSFIAYGDLNLSLYSLIAIWVMTKMSDAILSGFQSLRAYYIVSAKPVEIANKIMQDVKRGVTGFNSKGMYTNAEQTVLMTIVTREQSVELRQLVASIDSKAFLFSTTIIEAIGSHFEPLVKDKEEIPFNKDKNDQEVKDDSRQVLEKKETKKTSSKAKK